MAKLQTRFKDPITYPDKNTAVLMMAISCGNQGQAGETLNINERIMHRNGKQLIPIPVGIGRCKFINDLAQKEIQSAIDILKEISLSFVS